ncbi:hypothetical protein CXB51_017249 [Gossypium anomalum]|uniref:Uncharacterized protein n=1 Tax=Gossypium anomalum TaxID=47600 RepID=A0A8J6D0P8_9ROSI|nr:hypothetical protein CXB51_017249 [Gossypium anomalum]
MDFWISLAKIYCVRGTHGCGRAVAHRRGLFIKYKNQPTENKGSPQPSLKYQIWKLKFDHSERRSKLERVSMCGLASASIPTSTFPSFQQSKIQTKPCINPCNSLVLPPTKLCSSDLCLTIFSFGGPRLIHRSSVISRSSTGRGGSPGSGDNESRNVLDAFFLGKAVAEALNERIESTIGEFLSVVGRLQAEQQKQVQDFQEEVLERAKRAKEQAAREALEAQGLIPKSTSLSTSMDSGGTAAKASPSAANNGVSTTPSSYNPANPAAANTDPGLDTKKE